MMNKILFMVVLLIFGLTACSNSDSDNKDDQSGTQTDVTTEKINLKIYYQSGYLKEAYQFIYGTCDTGLLEFKGSTPEDVKTQLCSSLQNRTLNKNCAEHLRSDYFAKKCIGLAWTPYDGPAELPASPINPQHPPQDPKVLKLKEGLERLIADELYIAWTLKGKEKEEAQRITNQVLSCGFGFQGTECLDSFSELLDEAVAFSEDGKATFYTEIQMKGMSAPVAYIFSLDQLEPTIKIKKVEISKILKRKGTSDLLDYLKDQSNLGAMIEITPAQDTVATAWEHFKKPVNLRELHHLTEIVLRASMLTNSYEATTKLLAPIYSQHRDLIVQSSDELYQDVVYNFVSRRLPMSAEALLSLNQGLLTSKSESIRTSASIYVLNAQPQRAELKASVLKAFADNDSEVRKSAVIALSKAQKTTDEENKIILMIGDYAHEVSKEAIQASSLMKISENHLPALKALSDNNDSETRFEAAKLLGRLNTESATLRLIEMLSDYSNQVRKEVVAQLSQESLSAKYISAFKKQLENNDTEVRRDAAQFLGKIQTDESMTVLIAHMDDYSNAVSDAIDFILEKYPLKTSHASALIKQFKSNESSTRKRVAKLLGKIKSPQVMDALVDQLANEYSDEVKKEIVASIKALKS